MTKTKQQILKALLDTNGEKKICYALKELDEAFDILLNRQKEEFKRVVEKQKIKEHPCDGHWEHGYNEAVINILKAIEKL